LPAGISGHFDDLQILVVAHTGLKEITQYDLQPFTNIQGLYLDYNSINSLSGNLFIYNKNLKELNLKGNKIYEVEANTFSSLDKLTSLNFSGNDCFKHSNVHGAVQDKNSVQALIQNIILYCKAYKPNNVHIQDYSYSMSSDDEYIDF
jgi:hypothetical protein